MSDTTAKYLIIIATAVCTALVLCIVTFLIEELAQFVARCRRRRKSGDERIILYDKETSAEEFVHSFGVELIPSCKFYNYLERTILRRDGDYGWRKLEKANLRGFKELRRNGDIKTLRENLHRFVEIKFEQYLLDAYLNESGVHNTNAGSYIFYCSVPPSPHASNHGHADAGSVTDEVNRECGKADEQGENGDHGGN